MVMIQGHAGEFGRFADPARGVNIGPGVGRQSAIAGDRRIGVDGIAVHNRAIAVASADQAEGRAGQHRCNAQCPDRGRLIPVAGEAGLRFDRNCPVRGQLIPALG